MDVSIFSPFSKQYHAFQDLIGYTHKEREKGDTGKAVACAAAIFGASILVGTFTLGFGGVALFRTLVNSYVGTSGKTVKVAKNCLNQQQSEKLIKIIDAQKNTFPACPGRYNRLREFLLQDSFNWQEKDYDLGIEDYFGVLWISPGNGADLAFLQQMQRKYPSAIKELGDKRFGLDETTRLANNNIASLFDAAKKHPEIQALLKEAIVYCLLRDKS